MGNYEQTKINSLMALFGKGAEMGAAGAKERISKDADMEREKMKEAASMDRENVGQSGALSRLIKGNEMKDASDRGIEQLRASLEQQKYNAGLKRTGGALDELHGKFPDADLTIHPDGALGVNQPDPSVKAAKTNTNIMHLSDRIGKTGLDEQGPTFSELEKTSAKIDPKTGLPVGGMVTNPDYLPKFAGPIASRLPQPVRNLGEMFGFMPKGQGDEAMLAQSLYNRKIHDLSGSAVNRYEEGRALVEQGLSLGGDPKLVTKGVQVMKEVLDSQGANVAAGFDPNDVETFRQRGGKTKIDDYLPSGPTASAIKSPGSASGGPGNANAGLPSDKMKRMLELQAKARGGR